MAARDSLHALLLTACNTMNYKSESSTSRRQPRSHSRNATGHFISTAPRRRATAAARDRRHHCRPHHCVLCTHSRLVLRPTARGREE